MNILEIILKGIVAVGDVLCDMDEKFDGIERKMNREKTFDESIDEVERKLLKGKTVKETICQRKQQ